MPIASRPYEVGGHSTQRRQTFRPAPDGKRFKGNGNGNGHGESGTYARGNGQSNNQSNNTRATPPESTNAENFYYLKQMNARTPMVIILTDGEEIRGWIEWYDKSCLKVNRSGAPNLLIQKLCIKYLYKQEDEAD